MGELIVDRRMEGNEALAADQISDAGLLGPAVGFVRLELEFCHGFHRVTRRQDFCVLGVKLVRCRRCAGKSPICFFIEAVRDGFDRAGQEIVVIGDREGQPSLYSGELR
jgi:hypothetical protein